MAIFQNEVRALLWLCDDGKYVLDRCYPAGHWGIGFLRAWARKKNYLIRNAPDYVTDETNNQISDGKEHFVTLRHEGLFPYMDTFKYAAIGSGTMITSNGSSFGTAILSQTDGNYYKKSVCTKCGIVVNENVVYITNGDHNMIVCSTCFSKTGFICSICKRNYLNDTRYKTWNVCEKCHTFVKGFSTHNKCSCYKCVDLKRHYSAIIEKEVLREKKGHNAQMQFEFAY